MSTRLIWKKRQRILKNDEFKAVFQSGKKFSRKWLRLCLTPGTASTSVFGITLSKKIKGAVLRNYYKRVIREVLRKNQYQVQPGWKIIINVFSSPEPKLTHQTVQDEILGLLKHGKVLFPDN
jgi:ribonuclease P protein component